MTESPEPNKDDWKDLTIRKRMIYIEQSCRHALRAFAFEPNDANTWIAAGSTLTNLLTNLWKQGWLAGPSHEDAFMVNCGLGNTLTPDDLPNDYMMATIKVALVRPAEFIEIVLMQKMKTSG